MIVLSQDRGRVKDTIEIGAATRFQPSLAKGWMYLGTTNGQLMGIDLDDRSADGWTMWGGGPTHNGA